jgi:hypothetical protein
MAEREQDAIDRLFKAGQAFFLRVIIRMAPPLALAGALQFVNTYLQEWVKKVAISVQKIPIPPFGIVDIGCAVAIVVLGVLLYAFRCRWTRLYGQVEIAVGIFIAFHVVELTLGTFTNDMGGVFTALGALYIIVRGFDNIYRTFKPGDDITLIWNYFFFGRRVSEKL